MISAIICETQLLLQYNDKGHIPAIDLKKRIEELIPSLDEEDRRQILCQCYDRQLYSELDIEDKWGFKAEEERKRIREKHNN